jgi:enamine deaminase RidA (YjgF/YER057c/UK114 family)
VDVDSRLAELGIELPEVGTPIASYIPIVTSGSLAFVSGQVPAEGGRPLWTGRLGDSVQIEDGQQAARTCALRALAVLREGLGSLDRVRRIVKLTVFVASAPDFVQQPTVANAASELFQEVFGEAGRHARSAVGVAALPLGVPVELELIAEIEPG